MADPNPTPGTDPAARPSSPTPSRRWRLLPGRAPMAVLALLAAATGGALALGLPAATVGLAAGALLAAGTAWAVADLLRSAAAWRRAPLRVERRLPAAFALGVATPLWLEIINPGDRPWRGEVFDEIDPAFGFEGLPATVEVPAHGRTRLAYQATGQHRGPVRFGGVQLRFATLGRCFEWIVRVGEPQEARIYPNFAAVAGYAWLADDRRLGQIGIKTFARRGAGTDFRQLADYRTGDPVRHIDWKATLRRDRLTVREFQDETNQRVFFLLDCGRRMRADDGALQAGGSHFDQALNALLLLGHVALKEGDEVGVMTFGNAEGEPQRECVPRKGLAMLQVLTSRLYDIQPSMAHSDYLATAQDFLRRHPRRALVILITNFRDEDAPELRPALQLLRRRHLVMVASLREKELRRLAAQPLDRPEHAVEVASAHLFDQSRRDAFSRVVGKDPLSIDVEPAQLAVELINRYRAVKKAGML